MNICKPAKRFYYSTQGEIGWTIRIPVINLQIRVYHGYWLKRPIRWKRPLESYDPPIIFKRKVHWHKNTLTQDVQSAFVEPDNAWKLHGSKVKYIQQKFHWCSVISSFREVWWETWDCACRNCEHINFNRIIEPVSEIAPHFLSAFILNQSRPQVLIRLAVLIALTGTKSRNSGWLISELPNNWDKYSPL